MNDKDMMELKKHIERLSERINRLEILIDKNPEIIKMKYENNPLKNSSLTPYAIKVRQEKEEVKSESFSESIPKQYSPKDYGMNDDGTPIKKVTELKEGQVNFQVIGLESKISKSSGGEMIEAIISITGSEGESTTRDYFPKSLGWKVKQFCESIGVSYFTYEDLEENIPELLSSPVSGIATTKIKKSERWGDQTVIDKYIKKEEDFFNDDVPF